MKQIVNALLDEFTGHLGIKWAAPPKIREAAVELAMSLGKSEMVDAEVRQSRFFALVNEKLDINANTYRAILDTAAKFRVYPNYRSKCRIRRWLNCGDKNSFCSWLATQCDNSNIARDILKEWQPASPEQTNAFLRRTIREDERAEAITQSLASGFLYFTFDTPSVQCFFSSVDKDEYESDFYTFLRKRYPEGFERNCSLVALFDRDLDVTPSSLAGRRDNLFSQIASAHEKLDNHCMLAVHLTPDIWGRGDLWSVCADTIIFAEKRLERRIPTPYFRSKIIEESTVAHVHGVQEVDPRFDLGNEGLYFKDCFVLGSSLQSPSLLLLFEKNERDETPIPCPACRSSDVRANSYPVLGVRSWECHNRLCPKRSKYNRGNRYSLSSLIKQGAIEDEHAQIPTESLRAWSRDILENQSREAIVKMLLRHYTLPGDVVQITGRVRQSSCASRKITPFAGSDQGVESLESLAFFRRVLGSGFAASKNTAKVYYEDERTRIIHGEASSALRQMPANFYSGAITSPPYFNARKYSQWDNIYCYLHDMQSVASEVYRTLRPGGLFLYNVFDYFDNERNIVLSLMGKKRVTLGAYATHLFRRIGFRVVGNTIWDKGEIEGKRNFNGGNTSPYYQAPHNCWEHVLVFSKGDPLADIDRLPFVIRARPVIKMVRGENRHGHTAPFPTEIPQLLLRLRPEGGHILDPFGGSMTTAIAARHAGVQCTCIELSEQYCQLGVEKIRKSEAEPYLPLGVGQVK